MKLLPWAPGQHLSILLLLATLLELGTQPPSPGLVTETDRSGIDLDARLRSRTPVVPWLIRNQNSRGDWFSPEGVSNWGGTALATLCLHADQMGRAFTPSAASRAIRKGRTWLRQQVRTGMERRTLRSIPPLDRVLAAYTLLEVDPDPRLRGKERRFLSAQLLHDQALHRRLFPSRPNSQVSDKDVATLRSWWILWITAREALGLETPSTLAASMRAWYRCRPHLRTTLSRLLYGISQKPRSVQHLLRQAQQVVDGAAKAWQAQRLDASFLYQGTVAIFQIGGKPWQKWRKRIEMHMPGLQIVAGPAGGSFPPKRFLHGTRGRARVTALSILTLMVYYRYGNLIR